MATILNNSKSVFFYGFETKPEILDSEPGNTK